MRLSAGHLPHERTCSSTCTQRRQTWAARSLSALTRTPLSRPRRTLCSSGRNRLLATTGTPSSCSSPPPSRCACSSTRNTARRSARICAPSRGLAASRLRSGRRRRGCYVRTSSPPPSERWTLFVNTSTKRIEARHRPHPPPSPHMCTKASSRGRTRPTKRCPWPSSTRSCRVATSSRCRLAIPCG